jgi:Nickel responsive protein SCO4226-like
VPSYLVEVYLPRSRAHEARATGRRARAAAERLSHEGTPIRYVRTTFLPDDETCFHLFEAASAEVVEEVSRRAELGRARVVPAIEASQPARRRAT